jgi:hypothetical protein
MNTITLLWSLSSCLNTSLNFVEPLVPPQAASDPSSPAPHRRSTPRLSTSSPLISLTDSKLAPHFRTLSNISPARKNYVTILLPICNVQIFTSELYGKSRIIVRNVEKITQPAFSQQLRSDRFLEHYRSLPNIISKPLRPNDPNVRSGSPPF